jgi:hypothetical protein
MLPFPQQRPILEAMSKLSFWAVTCAVAFLVPATVSAQSLPFAFEVSEDPTLDEVAEDILLNTWVLADLRVTRAQLKAAELRIATQHFVGMMDLAALVLGGERGGDESDSSCSSPYEPRFLLLDDLSEEQRRRARQLAIQLNPLESLRTRELRFALDLSDKQRERLDELAQ